MTGAGGIGEARVQEPGTLTDVIVDLQFDLGITTRLVDGGTRALYDVWERGNPNVATFDRREDAAACLYRRQTDRVAAHLLSDAVVERATNALITAATRQIGDAADSDTVGRIRQRAMRAALQAALQAAIGAASERDGE